ncbi:MAG: SDR family NAD(P)-dependent oxidoreductase [Verrucomicrobiota bacterium]
MIHNAATGHFGRLAESADIIERLVQVNLTLPLALTHGLIDRCSKVAFVSSVASVFPCPDYSVYSATKAALDGFARSLAIEEKDRVAVQVIHPGATRTGMHEKMGISKETMDWTKFTSARTVAEKMLHVIDGNRSRRTIGAGNHVVRTLFDKFPLLDRAMKSKAGERFTVEAAAENRTCVITGAADGIGRALARRYAGEGYKVVGIDFDPERSERTRTEIEQEGGQAEFIQADLSKRTDLDRVLETLAAGPGIDVFIHNAGISSAGRFRNASWNDLEAVLRINLLAPLLLTHGVIQRGTMRRNGSLIYLSSLSKYVGYPGAAVYAATKDGLASYARSLRAALHAELNVLTVFPGPTRTEHARRYSPDNSKESNRMAPETLAEKIVQSQRAVRAVLVPGGGNKLCATLGHWHPGLMEWAMKKAILDKLPD